MTVDFGDYSRIVFRFALSLTGHYSMAEELMQETMLRALRQGEKLSEIDNLRAWLFTVAINVWRDQCRKSNRQPVCQPLNLSDPPQSANTSDAEYAKERLSEVLEYFQRLPERQREVLYLRTIEEFSIAEIATVTGSTPGSVKTNLSLARKRLRQRFESQSKQVRS